MPENEEKEVEKSEFDDLPEREPEGEKKEEAKEEGDAVVKAELERIKGEKALVEEKLFQESRARADTRRENKELKRKLKEKEAEEEVEPEEEVEDKPQPKINVADNNIDRVVDQKLYQREVNTIIKGRVKFKDEAEVLAAYVEKAIAAGLSTGDPESDVAQAEFRLSLARKGKASIPSPSSVSGGPYEEPKKGNKGVVQMRKELFQAKDAKADVEKFGDGEITY